MLVDRVAFVATASGTSTFASGSAVGGFLTLAQAVSQGTLSDGQTVSYVAQDSVTSPTQAEWGHGTFNAGASTLSRTTVLGNINSGTAGTTTLNFTIAPTVYLTLLAEDVAPLNTLSAATTYFVSTTGSDSNNGLTSGTAWLTLQHAMDYISQNIDAAGFTITVQIADGTYNGFHMNRDVKGIPGLGLLFQGNVADRTKVVITSVSQPNLTLTASYAQFVSSNAMSFNFVSFDCKGSGGIVCSSVYSGGTLQVAHSRFLDSTNAVTGELIELDAAFMKLNLTGSTTIEAGTYVNLIDLAKSANITLGSLTFNGSVTFSEAMIFCDNTEVSAFGSTIGSYTGQSVDGNSGTSVISPSFNTDLLGLGGTAAPTFNAGFFDNSVYADGFVVGNNGQIAEYGNSNEELTTIAAAASTNTTMKTPANSLVLGVSVRVVTVIPTAATFTVTAGGKTFNTVAVNTAAGTTDPGTAAGVNYFGSPTAITITPNIQPAAATGQVRVTIYYITLKPPIH